MRARAETNEEIHNMKSNRRALGALMGVIALVAVGCGGDTADDADGPVVEVEMVDVAFEPDVVTVPVDEPVTFRFTNTGVLLHEAVIGTAEEQEAHAGAMGGDDGHDGHDGHDDSAVMLASGESGDLVRVFTEPGEYLIGCHIPGHYEAGMLVTVTVE